MIIGKTAVALAAIFLVTITKAEARLNEFCDSRYCGQYQTSEIKVKNYYHKKKYSYKKKSLKSKTYYKAKAKVKKPVQLASIGPEPLGEAARETGSLLAKAISHLGGNPTGWRSLWCARFICVIAPNACERLKGMGLNPNWARDYARLPHTPNPKPGDLVVLTRGRGGHIGVFDKFDKRGNPIIVSGNHGRKVARSTYPKYRVLAYVTL